jgi:hypothetical protein
LNGPITAVDKTQTTNHTIIISYNITSLNKKILKGYLKYGIKDLFFYKKNGIISQSSPICLLDFYVDENVQREGIGLSLFKKMLEVNFFIYKFIVMYICIYMCIYIYIYVCIYVCKYIYIHIFKKMLEVNVYFLKNKFLILSNSNTIST